jgi:hypothetical protein
MILYTCYINGTTSMSWSNNQEVHILMSVAEGDLAVLKTAMFKVKYILITLSEREPP